jgi:hypothetical protein
MGSSIFKKTEWIPVQAPVASSMAAYRQNEMRRRRSGTGWSATVAFGGRDQPGGSTLQSSRRSPARRRPRSRGTGRCFPICVPRDIDLTMSGVGLCPAGLPAIDERACAIVDLVYSAYRPPRTAKTLSAGRNHPALPLGGADFCTRSTLLSSSAEVPGNMDCYVQRNGRQPATAKVGWQRRDIVRQRDIVKLRAP